jgi:collagenase-like PrtC family protease
MSEFEKSTLIAPCHFDKDVADFIADENNKMNDLQVSELYGAVSNEVVRHGRAREAVKNISRKEAVEFRDYLDDKGIGFIYLLNAPFNFDNSKETRIKVEEYLDWIVNEVQAEAVTISSHDLARFVRDRYESLKIYISTISAVGSIEQYDNFMDVGPSRVVLQYDQNRNWKNLGMLARHANHAGAELELMLNESCLRGCVNRQGHYSALGATEEGRDTPFLTVCNSRKILYPYEFLKSNYIRPEDLEIYEDMGIKRFKITGRSKPAEWLPETIRAYRNRKFDGNLVRLLGIDPNLQAENWTYINNSALDGFLCGFNNANEDEYSEQWIQRMYENGDFYLTDGTDYAVNEKGILTPKLLGEEALRVVKNECQ